MNKLTIVSICIFVAIVVVLVFVGVRANKKPGKHDSFAQCISDTGAKFYGAFWCPHCADQKKEFGTSAKYLVYVECSTPDGKGQTQVCVDEKIEGYPTWIHEYGFSYTSEGEPEQCGLRGTPDLSPDCQKVASEFLKSWIFPGRLVVQSETDPTIVGSVYDFAPNTRTGQMSLEQFEQSTECELPPEV